MPTRLVTCEAMTLSNDNGVKVSHLMTSLNGMMISLSWSNFGFLRVRIGSIILI